MVPIQQVQMMPNSAATPVVDPPTDGQTPPPHDFFQPTSQPANPVIPAPPGGTSAAAATPSAESSWRQKADDLDTAIKFTVGGLQYNAEQGVAGTDTLLGKSWTLGLADPEHALDNQPVPTIERPVVVVPGWTSTLANYAPLVNHLTENGANGGQTYFVKQGQFYTLGTNGQMQPLATPPANAKVFEMVFTDTHQSPESNLPELKANMDAIVRATGVQKIDTMAHSMGGLDVRLYLDGGGSQINRLMMVGTPNHGTVFGDEGLNVVDSQTGWAEKLGGLSTDDTGSLQDMRVEADNPFLQSLNSRWDFQRSQVAAVQTEANGLEPTPTVGILQTTEDTGGDGLVPETSVGMPGVTNKVYHENLAHRNLMFGSTAIYGDMMQFFGWT